MSELKKSVQVENVVRLFILLLIVTTYFIQLLLSYSFDDEDNTLLNQYLVNAPCCERIALLSLTQLLRGTFESDCL